MRSLLPVALLLLPALARAEAPPAEPSTLPPPHGKIDLRTPPPSEPVGRSYHLHSGFYARASVGFGSLGATFDDDHPSGEDLSGAGLSLGMDLMLGGSPTPGVSIGGAFLAQGAFSAEFDRDPYFSEDRSLTVFLLGPFVDGFPSPTKGWHLGGMLGLAASSIEESRNDGVSNALGFGGAAWVGHDFWVGEEWSIGPMLRLTGTLTQDRDTDANASSLSVLFLFSALRN